MKEPNFKLPLRVVRSQSSIDIKDSNADVLEDGLFVTYVDGSFTDEDAKQYLNKKIK